MKLEQQTTTPYQYEIIDDENGNTVLERVSEEVEAKIRFEEQLKNKGEKTRKQPPGLQNKVDLKQKAINLINTQITTKNVI